MNPIEEYVAARDKQVKVNMEDRDLKMNTSRFFGEIVRSNYVKNFTWAGVPILQLPSDIMVMQEIILTGCIDNIVETGVAFGGMTCFYSHMLEWGLGEKGNGGRVISVDIDIRPHTREVIAQQNSALEYARIFLFEGSSIDDKIVMKVKKKVIQNTGYRHKGTLVSLDSHHTHDHVLAELRLYSPLVSVGSYIVAFDTTIEEYGSFGNVERPWGKGNNPATAVRQFLSETDDFVVDREVEQRALLTAAPGGWLRRVK